MKFFVFMAILLLFIVISTALIAKKTDVLAPLKMPANIEELSTWDEDDIYTLLRKTLKCNDVPNYSVGEPPEFKRWRDTCQTVREYWSDAYNKEKIKEGLEKFKSLDLPE